MAGYELGSSSYSSQPNWKAMRAEVQEEFEQGHERSQELSSDDNKVIDARNKTSYSIYNKKRENSEISSSYDNWSSIMAILESGDIEQIRNNPYLSKFIQGNDFSLAFKQKGSVATQIADLMNQMKGLNLSLTDLQELFSAQSKQKSGIETAFWQQQSHNMGLVDEMRHLDRMNGFDLYT